MKTCPRCLGLGVLRDSSRCSLCRGTGQVPGVWRRAARFAGLVAAAEALLWGLTALLEPFMW